jgi:hypothetical protein
MHGVLTAKSMGYFDTVRGLKTSIQGRKNSLNEHSVHWRTGNGKFGGTALVPRLSG